MLAEAEKNLKTKRDKKSSEGEFLFHWARHQASYRVHILGH